MKKLSVFLLFFLLSLSVFAGGKPGITFKITKIEKSGDSLIFTGEVKGINLNSGGIPEYDHAGLYCEIPVSSNYIYPVFYEWYGIATNCYGYKGGCATEEQIHGKNIKSFTLYEGFLRPPNVWYKYGGLGQWEKKAPDTVKVTFTGKVPLEYMGKKARIHVLLKHVIGGPNAAWPGISYYHKAKEITLKPTNSVIVPAPNSNNSNSSPKPKPKPHKPNTKPCEKLKKKMNELKVNENMLSDLKWQLDYAIKRVKWSKDQIKKLKKKRDGIFLSIAGYSPYKNLVDDINRIKRLSRIGPNYGLVLQEMDDKVKLENLDETIHAYENALHDDEIEVESLKEKIKIIEEYKKCREKKK